MARYLGVHCMWYNVYKEQGCFSVLPSLYKVAKLWSLNPTCAKGKLRPEAWMTVGLEIAGQAACARVLLAHLPLVSEEYSLTLDAQANTACY